MDLRIKISVLILYIIYNTEFKIILIQTGGWKYYTSRYVCVTTVLKEEKE